MSTPGQYINDANAGLSIYQGATSGNAVGQSRAGLTAAKLYGNVTGASDINTDATGALDALGVYQGIKQGGWRGGAQATGSGLQLAGTLMSNPALSAAGGYVMAPLAIYNAVNNWQSGKTGSNALNGAEAGAAVGSIVPGIGTLIGGVIGGAVGALSSAFGPGATDPETTGVQGLLDATSANGNTSQIAQGVDNPYVQLAGLMDRRSSTLPMYQQYGRMGEQKFANDMTGQINDAFTKGIDTGPLAGDKWSTDSSGNYVLTTPTGGKTIYKPGDAASEVYNSTVSPWVDKMGKGYQDVGSTYANTTQGLLQDMTGEYMAGQAGNAWKAIGGDSPFSNIYSGSPFSAAAAPGASAPMPNPANANGVHEATMMKAKGGKLRNVYEGSFADRRRHFDDGGYVNYLSDYSPDMYDFGSPGTGASDMSNPYSLVNQAGGDSNNIVNAYNDPYAYGGGSSAGGGSGSAANPYAGLGSLLSGLGLSGSSIAPYAALLPLLQSALGGNKGAKPPSAPSQFTGTPLNMQTAPAFNRQQNPVNMSQQQWLHSAEGPEINFYKGNQLPTTPMSAPNAAQMTPGPAGQTPYTGAQGDPYSVVTPQMQQQMGGQGTMQAQPLPPGVLNSGLRPTVMAMGGHFEAGGRAAGPMYGSNGPQSNPYPYHPLPQQPPTPNRGMIQRAQGGLTTFDSTGSGLGGLGHVKGPGDGTSDSIKLRNAYLSNGEYVIDAPTVSALGNGSNDAGAKQLDKFRAGVRSGYGKHMARGKQPMKVSAFMGGQ